MFPEPQWVPRTVAICFFLIFYGHFAEAVWMPAWGKGRDWIDRGGILIRGLGYLCFAVEFVVPGRPWVELFWLVGTGLILFGRPCWELMVLRGKV